MDARRVNDQVTVAPQISVADVAEIARAGYKSIVCNRPDGEEDRQAAYSEIAAEAERHGLAVRWQPVISGHVSDEEGQAFGAIVGGLPAPVFAYCRSGTRCIVLWSLSQAGQRPAAEIIAEARAAGYDLASLAPRLEMLALQAKV